MLLSASNITKYHNDKCILDDVTFTIEEQDKIALIGVNGTGKSTFLKIVAGIENYEGKIIRKNGLKIAYLAQEPNFKDHLTIFEQVQEKVDLKKVEEYEIKSVLTKLGINDFSLKISQLSGGQKRRVDLAIALLETCDLLILDEPTNHLDNDMIEWLEKYLLKLKNAVLMVTHDRYFLDRITQKILEIDRSKIYSYDANYSLFLEQKAQREENALAVEKKRKSFLRKEIEWIRAGVQARGTKSKERIAKFEALNEIADIQTVEQVKLIGLESRLGKKTIEWHHLGMSYGEKVLFSDFEYNLQRNDRIGILGNNGSGKSTLLNILSKTIEPTEGEVIWGETVKVGYFKQGNDDLDDSKIVIDYVREISDDLQTAEGHFSAKQMLERFLFDSNLQYSKIGYLSGGERRRLYLLTILMQAPNILLFDEPTNDLDIQTLAILEDYLDEFNGAVLVVSHDRYFLDRVCDFLFVFENQQVQRYVGGYSSYFESRQPKEKKKGDGALQYSMQKKLQRETQPYLSSKDKKELESMESVIADLENQVKNIDAEMNEYSDFERINTLSKQREELCELIEQKNERWMQLMEIDEQIQLRKK